MKQMLAQSIALLVSALVMAAAVPTVASPGKRVTFQSDGNSLVGYLYQPEGEGPWPALIWNHGSEENPGAGPQFNTVASVFVPAGFVVFAPQRRGHGESGGTYIVDRIKMTTRMLGKDEANRLTVKLLETEQLDDQLAALAYVQHLPFVDPQRIVSAGFSFGGVQALLGAESRMGYRAVISISPGALMWDRNEYLRDRLVKAVGRLNVPVLLIQPARDASLGPSSVLGSTALRAGKPLTVKVYPAAGPSKEQEHCFGGASGIHVWAEDAKAFFQANLP